MPPARKDPTEADDACRPSTSRAFSPSLVPPVKRARTTPGVPSISSTRRQSIGNGGRQARMEEFIDEEELQDGLLLAAMKTAEDIIKEDEEEGKEKLEIDNEVIQATARVVWDALAEDWATDLVAFSRHAGRENIREDDVILMMRRNPEMMAEILAECAGEEDGESTNAVKRRSTFDFSVGLQTKETREDEDDEIMIDDVTTPQCKTSSTSVVPETPDGIGPLAHSTPLNGRGGKLLIGRTRPAISLPSPIREEREESKEGGNGSGRRVNRSILGNLSEKAKEEEEGEKEEGDGRETPEMKDDDFQFPSIIDLRHPREREEEEARMEGRGREEVDRELEQMMIARSQPGPSTNGRDYGRRDSPDLFEESEEKKEERGYDSFDDDVVFDDKENGGVGVGETTERLSESAALREMLHEEEEERRDTTMVEEKEHDSFDDDDSIQIMEIDTKKKASPPSPIGDVPSTSTTSIIQSTHSSHLPSTSAAAAATAATATSQRSSQDSFYRDEILQPSPTPAAAAADPTATGLQPSIDPLVLQQSIQLERPEEYDSFDDDDDEFVSTPLSRSSETTPKAIAPSPKDTVANRWSTVEIQEVISPSAAPKKCPPSQRGAFAEDIFGLNVQPGPSKPSPPTINKPSRTFPMKPSHTVSSKPAPTVQSVPINGQNIVTQAPANNTAKGPSTAFTSFSFFGEETNSAVQPPMIREDSDFLGSSNKPTTSTVKTPRGRGGRGGRFPRKIDPNSRVNRMIREQSTPVRLSPRPASRISEVVNSFEDDDFDASAFDD
ncbi:hypothetical protein PFISCL1PPCAC_5845 [Pristionchus fissidentatus]|uniref:Centromere protein S n=1 Tax=Pristionchus fissidentatus TaxID=1538716 RepID=A0AAV5V8K6_9BILA|nr:hypothetical protein PFISCL1PPCAC_5845 [Pristionchus fissidentatus]